MTKQNMAIATSVIGMSVLALAGCGTQSQVSMSSNTATSNASANRVSSNVTSTAIVGGGGTTAHSSNSTGNRSSADNVSSNSTKETGTSTSGNSNRSGKPGATSKAGSSSRVKYLTYSNKLYHFSLNYPSNWSESPRATDGDGRSFSINTKDLSFSNMIQYGGPPKHDAVIFAIGAYNAAYFTYASVLQIHKPLQGKG